jgi:hypothetical protein
MPVTDQTALLELQQPGRDVTAAHQAGRTIESLEA